MASDASTPTVAGPAEIWSGASGILNSKLHSEYIHRLMAGRDMHVVITASGETGVGKTTLAFALAMLWDQSGWHVGKACVADPQKYSRLYDSPEEVPPGSVLVLDEAEKASDARRSMSSDAVQLSQDFAAKRYRQVFGLMTAPSKNWIDKRLSSDSADYWIQCQDTDLGQVKGEARVYRLKTNEHYQKELTKKYEVITWPVLDAHPEFIKLNRKKEEELEPDKEEENYYDQDEVQKLKKEAYKEGVREGQREILHDVKKNSDMTQLELTALVDYSEGTVGNRIRNYQTND